jgi:FAD/FMN-containing dehydrogenase
MSSSTPVRSGAIAVDRLADGFRGEIVGRDHPDYAEARAVWNGSIDRHPAVVARCAGPDDVAAAIRFARASELELAVRSGGHSFPGLSVVDDGLVLDLSLMKDVAVDPGRHVARVEAGVLLGEMDRATQAHGLAVPTGAVTHTGVAGLTLGGGIGWLMRRHGLAIDQLRSVDLVTADGRTMTVSDERAPELFWGLRGGGGNFGVATAFEFELHPVGPEILSAMVLWHLDDAEEVGRAYRDWCADAPRDVTTALVLRRAPAVDLVPEHAHGLPVVGVLACWAGDLDEGERFLEPLRRLGTPVVDLTARGPYLDHQSMLDASYPHGRWVYLKACDVAVLSDDVLDVLIGHAARIASPLSGMIAWQLGGAVADPDADATAFGSRDAGFIVNVTGMTEGPDGFAEERVWTRACWEDLLPYQTSVYVNFLMDADTDRVRAAYGAERFDRLRALKTAYDPDNVFHLNQNIPPDRAEHGGA